MSETEFARGDLVPHELPGDLPTIRVPQQSGAITPIRLALLTENERIAILNSACNMSDEDIDEAFGRELKVRAAYVAAVDCVKEGGEIETRKKVVILANGKTHYGWSGQISNAVAMLVAFFGPPPWEPAILCVCDKAKNAKGQTFHYLRVTGRDVPAKKGK